MVLFERRIIAGNQGISVYITSNIKDKPEPYARYMATLNEDKKIKAICKYSPHAEIINDNSPPRLIRAILDDMIKPNPKLDEIDTVYIYLINATNFC